MPEALLWAPRAWVAGRWQDAVLLRADPRGHWSEVRPGVATPPAGATVLGGPALPGLGNAHSHAFQRAFAGLAERRESDADDFWSWRDRMYGVAQRITPDQLHAIAAQLYVELLRGGYTQVCEFHYLQHTEDGRPYADPATMSWALADAAADAGIGLTVLPVLYQRAGFKQPLLRHDQRRFATTPAEVRALQRSVMAARRPLLNAGVAIHSLRAAAPEAIATLLQGINGDDMPIPIHVAEQTQEVDDCLAATGARPIEWLCRAQRPDARWQLVHATHATPTEIDAVAASGAGIVLCPSTEANLGDGLPDLPRWLAAGVPIAIGSDSQVARSAVHELRWLEYGQRLQRRERNVAAAPQRGEPSTAAQLFNATLAGGARSAGQPLWGLVKGARADMVVLDAGAPGLLGVAPSHALDAWVFATDAPCLQAVYVAGQAVVAEGRHVDEAGIAARFADAMTALQLRS
ncbi:MAG TPA: formimidoylglutamate deiminase [Rhizobacter sp.]|nr:formimidoylglutamate deiminase [Rhizobacter sp.]